MEPLRKAFRARSFLVGLILGWILSLVQNPWSTFFGIRNRALTLRNRIKIGKLAVDDDVSFIFFRS